MSVLPPAPLLWAFLAASLVLAVTPGPGVMYILARTLSQGRAAGLASVLGVALGNLGNAIAASLGLAALFAVSATAFTVVKWAGAVYLIVLGVQAMRGTRQAGSDPGAPPAVPLHRIVRDGVVVSLLNPKTTLFFAAFLPQFMHGAAPVAAQSLALGSLFVVIAASTDLGYVLLASAVAPAVRGSMRWQRIGQRLSGGAFIALGVMSAASRRATD